MTQKKPLPTNSKISHPSKLSKSTNNLQWNFSKTEELIAILDNRLSFFTWNKLFFPASKPYDAPNREQCKKPVPKKLHFLWIFVWEAMRCGKNNWKLGRHWMHGRNCGMTHNCNEASTGLRNLIRFWGKFWWLLAWRRELERRRRQGVQADARKPGNLCLKCLKSPHFSCLSLLPN